MFKKRSGGGIKITKPFPIVSKNFCVTKITNKNFQSNFAFYVVGIKIQLIFPILQTFIGNLNESLGRILRGLTRTVA